MADSFFGFDTNLESDALDEGLVSDEEDEDYDALNDETFGEDVLTGDWEEDHEKLAELTELSRHGVKPENGDLSSQVAAFVLDDEPISKPNENVENLKPKPRPPPGFWVNNNNNGQPDMVPALLSLIKFQNACTVEEIERNLFKPPANSLRLEDLERKLISKPNPPGLNLRTGFNYSNIAVQPPRQPVIGSSLQKLPPFHQFQVHPPPHHLVMSPNLLGVRGGSGLTSSGSSTPGPLGQQGPQQPLPHQLYLRLPHNTTSGPMSTNSLSCLPGRGPSFPFPRPPPEDEYAGLMTNREKHWLASIQLMQLTTSTPFQDDYYYIMYQQRQSGHHGRKLGCPQLMKSLRDSQLLIKPTYTPLQFENSLGKLQVGSVTAPRKIIDTDIVESVECTASATSSKKVKQILLEIERMFSDVLLAEEGLSPLVNHTDDINPNQLFSKTVNILLKDEKLKTVLNIRKGKTLVLRVLSHLEVSGPLAHKVITILPSVAKRDSEQVMLSALPAIRHYLASASIDTLVQLSKSLEADLVFLLSNKFGISVITNMMERAEIQMSQMNSESVEWVSFVSQVLTLCHLGQIERPVVGIQGPTLARHLSRCTSANNQHIAILQKALSTMNTSVDKL